MKSSSKKKMTVILSAVLVLAIAIGATLAYLATLTHEEENVFTFAQNIRALLDEPNWDPKEGENLIPGYEVKKDPMITNKSDNGLDIFTAIRLIFADGVGNNLSDAEATRLLGLLDISWNANWTLIDGKNDVGDATFAQIYLYNGVLAPGKVSDPIFSSVTIKETISDEDMSWLAGIIMTHTDDCYDFPAHGGTCTITYKHHANCAIYGESGASAVAKGGTVNSKTCDCTPAQVHAATCNSMKGTVNSSNCKCDPPDGAIAGFSIKVQGAAVQAYVDGMDAYNNPAVAANLIPLFPAIV